MLARVSCATQGPTVDTELDARCQDVGGCSGWPLPDLACGVRDADCMLGG